jgi:hypothetical protein
MKKNYSYKEEMEDKNIEQEQPEVEAKLDKSPLSINIDVVDNGYVIKLEQLMLDGSIKRQTIVGNQKKFVSDICRSFINNELYNLNKSGK